MEKVLSLFKNQSTPDAPFGYCTLELGYCDLPGLTEAGVPMEELYAAGLKDRPKDGNATAPICIDDDNTITHSSSAGPPTVRPIAGDQASSQGTQIKIKTEAAPTNEDWNKHCYRVVYILLHRLIGCIGPVH